MLCCLMLCCVSLCPCVAQEEIYSSSYAAAAYLESIDFKKKVKMGGSLLMHCIRQRTVDGGKAETPHLLAEHVWHEGNCFQIGKGWGGIYRYNFTSTAQRAC